MKANARLCFNCKSPDHIVVDCPYEDKRGDGPLKLKKDKKEKKEKKEKKSITFTKKKKKGRGYVVTWDSDSSDESDDYSLSDDEKCNTLGVYHQLSNGFELKHDRLVEMTMPKSNLWE
jgi:hypothetical protein